MRIYFLYKALKRVIVSSFFSTIASIVLIDYLKNEFFYISFANFYESKLFLLSIIITTIIFLLSWLSIKNLKFGNILWKVFFPRKGRPIYEVFCVKYWPLTTPTNKTINRYFFIIFKSTKNYPTMCELTIYTYLPPPSNGVCHPFSVENPR